MRVTYDPSQQFPTFSRLLSRGSRFRRALKVGWASLLCTLAAICSMTLMTNAALAVYWQVWKTFEIVTPSQSIVLPVSLLVSSIVASFVGSQLGLLRLARASCVIGGLLFFYWVSVCGWIWWYVPDSVPRLIGGWFEHSFAWEDVSRAAYGEIMWYAAGWASLALWASVGLVIGTALQIPERLRVARMLGGVFAMVTVAGLLLGSIFYPLVVVEKRQIVQSDEHINSLVERCRELEKSGGHANKRTHTHPAM